MLRIFDTLSDSYLLINFCLIYFCRVKQCLAMLEAHGLTPETWLQELLSKNRCGRSLRPPSSPNPPTPLDKAVPVEIDESRHDAAETVASQCLLFIVLSISMGLLFLSRLDWPSTSPQLKVAVVPSSISCPKGVAKAR